MAQEWMLLNSRMVCSFTDVGTPKKMKRKARGMRTRCQSDATAPSPTPTSSIMEWDLVLFPDDEVAGPGGWSIGKVEDISRDKDEVVCQPLFMESEETGEDKASGVWLESHERGLTTVRLSEVRCLDPSTYDFAQRMAPDRVSNPHGTVHGSSGTSIPLLSPPTPTTQNLPKMFSTRVPTNKTFGQCRKC